MSIDQKRPPAAKNKETRAEKRATQRRAASLPDCREIRRLLKRPKGQLADYELSVISQGGEDGVVCEILRRLGFPTRRSVELGCGANGGNSGLLAACFDYESLMIDGNPELAEIARNLYAERSVRVEAAWVSLDTISDLLAGFVGPIDYLGVDLDGMDYWIWQAALEVVQPWLMVVEFNGLLGPRLPVTVPYDKGFDRHRSKERGQPRGYWGASLMAFTKAAKERGYRLVHATKGKTRNAFFIRRGPLPNVPSIHPRAAWSSPTKGRGIETRETIAREGVLHYFASRGWPLIEV